MVHFDLQPCRICLQAIRLPSPDTLRCSDLYDERWGQWGRITHVDPPPVKDNEVNWANYSTQSMQSQLYVGRSAAPAQSEGFLGFEYFAHFSHIWRTSGEIPALGPSCDVGLWGGWYFPDSELCAIASHGGTLILQ